MGDRIERVILYGSVARGDHGPASDVDLVVVAEDKMAVRRALRPVRADLAREGEPLVSAMIFTPEEFARFPETGIAFYQDVLDEGEVLVA